MPGWLGRYAAHPDPATAAANLVALVVAGNGPFYPMYALALIGCGHRGAWLTMLASPFFALVPVLSRRRSRAGRAALPLIGIVNTVWCSALLGSASAVGLFLLPCIVLAALLFRGDERWLMWILLGLAVGTMVWLTEFPRDGLMDLTEPQAAALARLDAISVTTLSGFVALQMARVLVTSPAARERSMVRSTEGEGDRAAP
jgi:hypothetical protein